MVNCYKLCDFEVSGRHSNRCQGPYDRPGYKISFDPDNPLNLVGFPDRELTGQEFLELELPACLNCGETIYLDRIDVTKIQQRVTRYVPGRWHCPNECDPRRWTE